MLDEPRELLLRALLPLYPPEPPPSPLELRDPPPLGTLRFPTRSPPPPSASTTIRTRIAASRATVAGVSPTSTPIAGRSLLSASRRTPVADAGLLLAASLRLVLTCLRLPAGH